MRIEERGNYSKYSYNNDLILKNGKVLVKIDYILKNVSRKNNLYMCHVIHWYTDTIKIDFIHPLKSIIPYIPQQ